MHGDDHLRFQQTAGVGGLTRPHGENIANGQHHQVRLIQLMDDVHVAENVGVAGMVDLHSILKLDDVPAGLAAVDDLPVVFDSARVVGMDHGHTDVPYIL